MQFVAALLTVGLLTLAAGAPSSDPCLPENHSELDQPSRSTAVLLKGKGNDDANLAKGWYRFTSGAGGDIPTVPPKLGHCSSKKGIWLNDTLPPLDTNIHTLNLCYFLSDLSKCGIKLKIRAKACIHYNVYELVPTSSVGNSTRKITESSYCAGTEKLCPAGQTSATGFTTNLKGCYVAPTVGTRPLIDIVELKDTFEFHCLLSNTKPKAAYNVIWKLGSTVLHSEELQFGHTVAKLKESQLVLPRRQIVLGRNLTCSIAGRYTYDPPGRWGAPRSSEPYFVGIEVSDASGLPLQLQSFTLTLPENNNHQSINIRSTIPLKCDPVIAKLSQRPCKIEIAIRNDNSMDTKPLRCKNGLVEQLKLATCRVTITPDNWSASQPISIRATKDFKYDGTRSRIIEFQMIEGPSRSIWNGYVPHKIEVITEDFRDNRAQCSSLNDPHMRTFDGHRWHNYFEGEFVLYRHTELPFEVRAFYKKCSPRSSVTCNCAVAARSGDDVIIVDRCNSMGDVKIWGSDKKVEYNLLRTRTISTDDIISPNFKIFAVNGGREYSIYFPHGAMLRAQLTTGGHAQFMNLWLNPSPADFNRTEGMCGNFNGDKTDDLRWRNNTLFRGAGYKNNQQPKEYSKHWRVLPKESIYNGQVPGGATTYKAQYCSCVKPTGLNSQEYLDCQLNSDALRCDQRGDDITQKNFEYSAEVKTKPFKFDPDFNPPEPSWPTPSGWTKANATLFCEDFIKSSKAYLHCNITIDDDLEMCVEDIKLSDGIEFAMTALESFKDKCLTELSKELDGVIPGDAFCHNECSQHGDCVDGDCHCHHGYAGEDCSLAESAIPNVYFTPFCDVATEQCESARIYGEGFFKSPELTCAFQPAVIRDGKLTISGDKEQVNGVYENFAEVKCPISPARSKRATTQGPSAKSGQFAVTVANKQSSVASNVIIYTQYNSICQTCNTNSGECVVKDGMCLIEGHCYTDGDVNPSATEDGVKPYCDPHHSITSWRFPEKDALPKWAIGVIGATVALALVSVGIVLYVKLIRKRSKVVEN